MKSHETPIKPYEFSGVHFHLKEESVSDYHNPVPDTNPRVTHHHRIPLMTVTRAPIILIVSALIMQRYILGQV